MSNAPSLAALWALAVGIAFVLDARALEDPTRPPRIVPVAEASASAPARELSAILTLEGRRTAVIDGRRVQEGDAVGAATVARIEATRVELHGPDGPVTLTLFGPSVKTPVRESSALPHAGEGKESR